MQLSLVRPHEPFIIRSVNVGREVGRRLADMGCTEGTEGVIVRRGGFGGPMQVRIHGYDLLIRRDEAAKIDVEPVGPARRPGRGLGRGLGRGRGARGGRWFARSGEAEDLG
ncbi:MAG: ferrous iron transport protein A [Spirochaetaceae bacterium]|nr:ferrous iron transport protein A [Spirochaetaceae bacterium]